MRFQHAFSIVFIVLVFATTHAQINAEGDSLVFLKGADVSFIPQIEDLGGVYRVNGVPQDPLIIFKDHGINCIRLKLWHTPSENYNNLEKILYMAQRIKDQNLKFLLDFHYSDTWADPGRQTKPAAWVGAPFEALKDSVYNYTKAVIKALCDQGTLPDFVQIGNEITQGMLWNDGRVGGSFDNPQQWSKLGELIKAGVRGVRESCEGGDEVRIMIHRDRGGDNAGSQWFFGNLISQGVDFDIIGLSYYPFYSGHGTLDQVRANLNDLAVRYNKDLIIVETAYPWTLQWFDSNTNIVGSSTPLHPGYPASIDGQKGFLRNLMNIVRNVPNQKGAGVFYWAPEYISVQPIGSPWENLALFDFSGNALSSMEVFLEDTLNLTPINVTLELNTATLMDTLRPHHFTQLRGEVTGISFGTLPDGKKVTWQSDSEIVFQNVGGDYWKTTFQMFPGDELSFKFWGGFNPSHGTFQRLGFEGPITPAGGLTGNRRVLIAGEKDTVLSVQYYNSTAESKQQFWQPFEIKEDSLAIYFRVNMGKAMSSGRFDPNMNGPVAVRGDATASGGSLDWNISRVTLHREEFSVNGGSFWSGVCYIPKMAVQAGRLLEYKFFIENDTQDGFENSIENRKLPFTQSLGNARSDTTIHWVYFDEPSTVTHVAADEQTIPLSFQLKQNYPNPFNNQTRLDYTIHAATLVNLSIYDIQGRLITTLVHGQQAAGNYSVAWNGLQKDGSAVASGIYFVQLETDEGTETRKALLMK
jgi:arabinogalactan endo-1,4-beta-galactosidase